MFRLTEGKTKMSKDQKQNGQENQVPSALAFFSFCIFATESVDFGAVSRGNRDPAAANLSILTLCFSLSLQ